MPPTRPVPTNIAIVEDDAGICEDLAQMIRETGDMACACVCRNGRAALHKIPRCPTDIVIMDIQLPDISGIKCTARLKQMLPSVQILMFTIRDDEEQIFQALEAGASGYLLKSAGPSEVVKALREIAGGGAPMTGMVSRKVVESFYRASPEHGATSSLTPREREVLGFLVKGYVSKEVADRLSISIETVNYHLKQIYRKMRVRSRTEAVVKYLRQLR
ncbi:MAG: response regulator transcription factor [Opitutaceae bacterium]